MLRRIWSVVSVLLLILILIPAAGVLELIVHEHIHLLIHFAYYGEGGYLSYLHPSGAAVGGFSPSSIDERRWLQSWGPWMQPVIVGFILALAISRRAGRAA